MPVHRKTCAYNPDSLTARIVYSLIHEGPMTGRELSELLGVNVRWITKACTQMCRDLPATRQRIYIRRYTYEHPGQRVYPRPVYSYGRRKHAEKPRNWDHLARDRAKRRETVTQTLSSVFDLGLRVEDRRKGLRAHLKGTHAPDIQRTA